MDKKTEDLSKIIANNSIYKGKTLKEIIMISLKKRQESIKKDTNEPPKSQSI